MHVHLESQNGRVQNYILFIHNRPVYLRPLNLPERVCHSVNGFPLSCDAIIDHTELLVESGLVLLQFGDLVDQVLFGVGAAGEGSLYHRIMITLTTYSSVLLTNYESQIVS